MVDELFDRGYQDGRAELNAGIDRALERIRRETGQALRALNRMQWSAPWRRPERNRRKDAGLA